MAGPVLWPVPPVRTEGLMSLVTRTKARNLLPSAHVLLRQVGAGHANNPTAALIPELDEARLASILRQPVEEVVRRRHPPRPETGFVDFFGSAVRADEIVFRRRRFAPAALAISPHSRATWSLKTVPCCTETWEYLVDACACGAVQRWQAADRLDRCDVCNAPLVQAPTNPVDPSLRAGLGLILGVIDPDEARRQAARADLPAALSGWDGGHVLELALALMPLAGEPYRPQRRELPPRTGQAAYARALSQAADLIRAWPGSLLPALERAVVRRSLSRSNVRYSGIADHIPALAGTTAPSAVRLAIGTALAPIRSEPGTTPSDQIAMMDATRQLARPLKILAPARRRGLLKTRVCLRANRLFPTLDRAEAEDIEDFLKNRISAEKASGSYGLPSYAVLLLERERLAAIETHPFIRSQYPDPQLRLGEFERFKAAVRAAACLAQPGLLSEPAIGCARQSEPGIPLHHVARSIGGGLKPWGRIFARLLAGELGFAIEGDAISAIRVEGRHASSVRAMHVEVERPARLSATCSQRDALEVLNLPAKHAHLLKTFADADDDWEMDWDAVLHLARTRVTLTEMCARSGLNGLRLANMLADAGCERSDRLGWQREAALAALSKLVPTL